eukprot:CAMPEP_0174911796 /NCGR_PEP_ID=MMETSP0167-20121228/78274_1 /TAXON_ID=38298 /ORGANISM="Rhodella maculata, Strain CCMP736" /LENGTH=44 /DNA_ID= /DNA_START= /DNA_END= /DNA_ORIENTATION=
MGHGGRRQSHDGLEAVVSRLEVRAPAGLDFPTPALAVFAVSPDW